MANDNDKSTQMQNILKRSRERAKTGEASTVGGQKELPKGPTPAGTPTGQATDTGGPTRLNEPPLQTEAREKTDVRMTKVAPKKAAPGYYLKGRYMTKPPPKPKSPPKKDLTASTLGGTKQKTPSQMGVSPATGKPTKTYGERAISYLEGLGTRVAPPGSVTRLRELPKGPPSTFQTRMESIGRVSAKSFPGKASRPGGIINIPEEAAKTKGPSLKAQRGTPAAAYRRKQFREKTAADVPQATAPVTPTGKGVEVLKGPGELGEGHLGSYRIKGTAAPVVTAQREVTATKKKVTTAKGPPRTTPPARKAKWWEGLGGAILGGIKKGAKAFQEAGKEMTAQAKTSKAPTGRIGTKEQAQKGAGAVKKVVVPETFKEK